MTSNRAAWGLPLQPAKLVLNQIYAGDERWINFEINEIATACEQEESAKIHFTKGLFIIRRILKTPHVRKALIIGCMLQMLQQLAAINTVMYYTGSIIESAGTTDKQKIIWIASAISGDTFWILDFSTNFYKFLCKLRCSTCIKGLNAH
ncbi:unnamed protein product [Dracunculus medinensis]|uniref:Odorant receptor n=1 Tax=Dracunculus medinensis TaxID=318479 RepID=A0A0N4UJ71_DRAME|nr:unnamed protein product [Dracunculus medinensis]